MIDEPLSGLREIGLTIGGVVFAFGKEAVWQEEVISEILQQVACLLVEFAVFIVC